MSSRTAAATGHVAAATGTNNHVATAATTATTGNNDGSFITLPSKFV